MCVHGSLHIVFLMILYYLMNRSLKFHEDRSFHYGDICKQYWLLKLINFQCILHIFTNIHLKYRQRWIFTEWLWDVLETRYQNGPVKGKWKHHFQLIFCILRLSHKHITWDEHPVQYILKLEDQHLKSKFSIIYWEGWFEMHAILFDVV